MRKKMVSPSLLSANFLQLENDINMINKSDADWFHLDIMDGVFVPNITFGFSIIEQIKKKAEKPLDVHLMIEKPERYINNFKSAGADILTVQYEACPHLHRTIQEIKIQGMKAGVAINPHTSVDLLDDILGDVDMVLIMSVNPGFGGQKFIQNATNKISKLYKKIVDRELDVMIQVDGGVDNTNAGELYNIGATCLVAGSYVFKSENPQQAIVNLKSSK